MKIRFCTFTGIDDAVRAADLVALSQKYPFVEWAVSCDLSCAGQPRYPSMQWIESFLKIKGSAHKAMHLCGGGLAGFIVGNPVVLEYVKNFERIQLNLDFETDRADENVSALISQMKKFPAIEFILGYCEETKHLLPRFAGINMTVLFDSSGGTGKKPDLWLKPLVDYECGYAGGMSPENIDQVLDVLNKTVSLEQVIWIDMESGVRTDNEFDLNKAEHVLKSVVPWAV